jgi:hypothetical protein
VSKIDRDNKKHSTSNGHSPHRPINPTGEGDWLFDGERPDAWHNSEADAARLRWTKKQLLKSPREPVEIDERPTSPFTLGDDPDEPNEPDPEQAVSPSDRRLPSDAVDLVKEDPQVVEEAQTRSRLSGEPQSRAPVHVYHHDPEYVSGEDDEVEEVYETAFPEERRTSESVDQGGAPGGDPIEQLEIIKEQVSAQTPSVDKQRGHTSPFDENNPWA